MNLNDKWHVTAFTLVASLLFFLVGAMWSAIFVIALPQDSDWCQEVVEIQTAENTYEERCVSFKDRAAELKHYHNQSMVQRNKHWLYVTLVLGSLLGTFTFHILPRSRGRSPSKNSLGGGVALGCVAAFLGPLVLGWILPAPIHWFPNEFSRIHEARQAAALAGLGIAEAQGALPQTQQPTNPPTLPPHAERQGAKGWPVAAQDAYVNRCSESMNSQGLPRENAQLYCRCFIERAEQEFGMREYDAMMKAQPDPKGSEVDRRLYDVLVACSKHLSS